MQCHISGLDHLDQDSVTPFWKSEPIGLVAVKSLCRLEAERAGGMTRLWTLIDSGAFPPVPLSLLSYEQLDVAFTAS
jgi:hypothetical protein